MIPALLLAAAAVVAAPQAGDYGLLSLAFDQGRVTGSFSDARVGNGTEDAPQFSCGFKLTGAWAGDHAEVLTWWPGETAPDTRIPGRLTVKGGMATLTLAAQPGGCDMTGDDLKGEGYSEHLEAARPWRELRAVRARTWFFPRLGAPRSRAYAVEGDTVAVLSRAGGWVEVEFVGGRKPVRGWLAEGDLYPTGP